MRSITLLVVLALFCAIQPSSQQIWGSGGSAPGGGIQGTIGESGINVGGGATVSGSGSFNPQGFLGGSVGGSVPLGNSGLNLGGSVNVNPSGQVTGGGLNIGGTW